VGLARLRVSGSVRRQRGAEVTGGKAHGAYRQYQVECRDVLTFKDHELTPWSADGVDVPLDLPDTQWTFDIALRGPGGSLVLAECRRTAGAVKQEEVAAFAYKVELVRKVFNIPVAGVFFAKKDHQIGAVKVGQFNGIQVAILEAGSTPPGFNLTFLRYDEQREMKCRDILMHVPSGSYEIQGYPATLIHTKASGETESR
jgi:hypothetical protein